MIIGLVGPVQQDIEEVVELLTSDKNIVVSDSIELLRLADRKTVNSLTIQDYHKKYFLKKLEAECGTVLVTGNIVLSEDILPWLLQEGGVVIVVSRNKMESYDKAVLKSTEKYWDDKSIQKYNLEVRFKRLYENLEKPNEGTGNLYLVDLSDDNSEILDDLIGSSEDWIESDKNYSAEELLSITTIRKDDDTMTMEESIKKAMRELGMEVDEDTSVPEKKIEKKEPQKPKNKPVKAPKEQPKTDFINPPEPEEDEEEVETETSSVFVKITDNSMALLLPVGLKLEKQIIGDMEFNVATIEVPDINNHKLQELEVKVGAVQSTQESPKRVPITTKAPKDTTPKEKAPVKTVVVSGDVKDLQEEKSRLDGEIKKYRQMGDIETVNALRKQRRAVRNKINALK